MKVLAWWHVADGNAAERRNSRPNHHNDSLQDTQQRAVKDNVESAGDIRPNTASPP